MTDRDEELRLAALDALYGGKDIPCEEVVTTEITCERVVALLTEYVDEELAAELRSQLDGHLELCPPCGVFLDEYRVANTTFREQLLTKVPADLESRLTSFLRQHCRCGEHDGEA